MINLKGQTGQAITSVPVLILTALLMLVFVILSSSIFQVDSDKPEKRVAVSSNFDLTDSRVLGEFFLFDVLTYSNEELNGLGIQTDLFSSGEEEIEKILFKSFLVDSNSESYTGAERLSVEQFEALFLPIEERFEDEYGCSGKNEFIAAYKLKNQNTFRYVIDYPSKRISDKSLPRYQDIGSLESIPELFGEKGKEQGYYIKSIGQEGKGVLYMAFKGDLKC